MLYAAAGCPLKTSVSCARAADRNVGSGAQSGLDHAAAPHDELQARRFTGESGRGRERGSGSGNGNASREKPGNFAAAQAQTQRPVPDAQAMGRSEVGHMEQAKLAQ
jgi:hypothetical protein